MMVGEPNPVIENEGRREEKFFAAFLRGLSVPAPYFAIHLHATLAKAQEICRTVGDPPAYNFLRDGEGVEGGSLAFRRLPRC